MKRKETLTGICFVLPGLIGFIISHIIDASRCVNDHIRHLVYGMELSEGVGFNKIYRIEKLFETV